MTTNRGTIGGSIVALVSAAIGLAVAFGVHVSPSERDAVISFATAAIAVAPLVGAAWDHSRTQARARVESATIVAGTSSSSAAAPTGSGGA